MLTDPLFPIELLRYIFTFLPLENILPLKIVCSHFFSVIDSPDFVIPNPIHHKDLAKLSIEKWCTGIIKWMHQQGCRIPSERISWITINNDDASIMFWLIRNNLWIQPKKCVLCYRFSAISKLTKTA